MKPIKLNGYGETLQEYPKGDLRRDPAPHQDLPADEAKELSTCVGIHAVCHSWVDFKEISETHNALLCRGCSLRFVFPNTVKTFGDLRAHCEKELAK